MALTTDPARVERRLRLHAAADDDESPIAVSISVTVARVYEPPEVGDLCDRSVFDAAEGCGGGNVLDPGSGSA